MPKFNYPLKKYEKAVEFFVRAKGFDRVESYPTKGSIFRFELFAHGEIVPCSVWVIHHSHTRRKEIWSREDYRKAASYLNVTLDDFLKKVKEL